jgi:hypothetical protein
MWQIRELAAQRQTSIETIAEAAGISFALIYHWLREHKHLPWFEGRLLRGKEAPANIVVATREQVRYCRDLWNYSDHCRKAGLESQKVFAKWIEIGVIPSLEWLKWLYGGPVPAGSLVVPASIQRLRQERTILKISRAAGLDKTTYYDWMKDPSKKAAIEFIEALTPRLDGDPQPAPRTANQRRRASERAA